MSYHPQSPSRDLNIINKKRKRISHESEQLAWTAARCSRLLRSISSRIAAIRKLADSNISEVTVKPKKTVAKRVASHWSTQDPVWMGDAKRKTGARTFAGRKKVTKAETQQKAPRDAAITFPSPFMRRIRPGEVSSPAVPFARPAAPTQRQSKHLPVRPGCKLEEAEIGLALAFSSILTTTSGQGPPRSQGARSLMSTCLRNVPQYIALYEEDEAEDDVDSSSELLSYLENLGTKENGGWSGLREVVRSQALYAICEAVQDEMLSEMTMKILIEHCGSQNAIPEGQEILTAWLTAGECITTKQIAALNSFGLEQNCVASTFRLMRVAGENQPTRLEAICRAPGFWNNILRSFSRAASFEAESFLSACFQRCLNTESIYSHSFELGLKETLMKLTTMAISATLLGTPHSEHSRLHTVVHRLAAVATFSNSESRSGNLHHLLVSCSLLLLGISQEPYESLSSDGLSHLLSTMTTFRSLHPAFADDIISSMATLDQHLHTDLIGIFLDKMVDRARAAPLFRQVALAAVTTKQLSCQGEEDSALCAQYISRMSTSSLGDLEKMPQTPFRKHSKASLRWEDGICEWVARTPFTAAVMAPPTPSSMRMEHPKFDDKENTCPEESEKLFSAKKETCTLQYSPDVLALSPRKRVLAESPLRQRQTKKKRLSNPRVVLQKVDGRRRTSRLSSRSCAEDDSADELGL